MIRHPGFCKVCGQPTHQIEKQFPLDHPLAGRPVKIGKPLGGIAKAHLVMSDGSWATITVHGECIDKITPEFLPRFWQDTLETMRFEEDNRALLGAAPLNQKQRLYTENIFLKMAARIPLGVMYCEAVNG